MKTLYIECNMGAAGDMLMSALLELLPDPDKFIERINGIGIPGVYVKNSPCAKCGITGTHISVYISGEEEESHDIPVGHSHTHLHDDNHQSHRHTGHEHRHTGLPEIREIIGQLAISEKVRNDVLAVYELIAQAESKAHGKPVETVHFHEVGMMDAVTDIVGVCLLMEEINPQHVVVSPIHVGGGQVRCTHGILPVPAPATAYILKGAPTYGGQTEGELCTPTGAALLKHFADEFGSMPVMVTEAIGYGMGKKDFPSANCVRAFIGESGTQAPDVVEIACNLDDITGEELAFALEALVENGALDVYVVPIQMKKGRPGYILACLCKPEDEKKMTQLILRHTTTLGVRSHDCRRCTLNRATESVQTDFGDIRMKTSSGFGVNKKKPEYEDLARLARDNGLTLSDIRKSI